MLGTAPLNMRRGFMRVLLGRLVPRQASIRISVLVIPTTSVRLSPVNDFLQLLNVSQDVFRFYLSSPLNISRTAASDLKSCTQQPPGDHAAYKAAINRYITQYDYLPQIDQFLKLEGSYPDLPDGGKVTVGKTPIIILGKERFIWDAPGYVITGDFEKDGYTALYSLEEQDSSHNNVCAISIEKLLVDEENISRELILASGLDGHPKKSQRQLIERVYMSSNIAHFLIAFLFNCVPSEQIAGHEQGCIMDLNLDGGLDVCLAENRICSQCSAQLENRGLPLQLATFLSAKSVERAALCLTQSVRRVIVIEQIAARAGKLAGWLVGVIVIAFLVAIVSNVAYVPEESSIGAVLTGFIKTLGEHPPTLALWVLGLASILFLILTLISVAFHWITKISRIEV
jgi:hypothetical protein